MVTMMTVFNFDLTNPTHAQIFSQVVALTNGANIPMQIIDNNSQTVSQPVSKTPVSATKSDKVGGITKAPYVATKDFKAQYEIKKQASKDGKELFCISRKNGWTKAEKACMNNAIKALDGIITIDVSYDKDGKTRTFKAWGYKTKKKAEEMLATLPALFTAEQLNKAL